MNTITENDIKFLQVLKSQGVSKEDAKQRLIDVKKQKVQQSSISEPKKESSWLTSGWDSQKVKWGARKDAASGLLKSAGETVVGGLKVAEDARQALGRAVTPDQFEETLGFSKDQDFVEMASEGLTGKSTEELLETHSPTEKVFKGIGDVAQFVAPATAATKGVKLSQAAANSGKLAKAGNSVKNALKVGAADAVASAPVFLAKEGELTEDSIKETAKNSAIGGAVGGGLNLVGDVVSSLKTSGSAMYENARNAAGRIAQGKADDQLIMMKALDEIETKGIESYQDLSNAFDETIKKNLTSLDGMLDASDIRLTTDNAVSAIKAGEETISKSPIEEGLDALDEFYTNVKQPEDLARIRELKQAFQEGGLSLRETNDLAREIGRQRSGFLASGNPSTSLSKQAYENIRTGLKDLVRSNIGDDSAKLLDQQVSDFIKAKELSDDMIDKVAKLQQQTVKRSWGERAGNAISKIVDRYTGGVVRGFMQNFLIPSGRGYKTLNKLDLDQMVKANINIIEDFTKKLNNKKFRDSLVNITEALDGIGEIQFVPISKKGINSIRNIGASTTDTLLTD